MSDPLPIKGRPARFVLIVLPSILIAFFAYQYFLYNSEIKEIQAYLTRKQVQLIEIKRYEKIGEQRKQETEKSLSEARALLPAALNIRLFMEDLERWAHASGVTVEDFVWHERKWEFYYVADCAVTLSGSKEGIEDLLARKDEFERLVTWGEKEPLDTGAKVKLKIYSAPWPKLKEFDLDAFKQKPCKDFSSGVWLWPFSKRIREIQEKLDRICPEIRERAEELGNLELLKDKAREAQHLIEVINHLTKSQQ